jgi:GxxExxY protein
MPIPGLLTEKVINAIFEVANSLGAGFLEKVSEKSLLKELALRGIPAAAQKPFPIACKGHSVGDNIADIVVQNQLLVEVKCTDRLANQHTAQCINYLRASGLTLCLLVNFKKPRVEIKRIVYGYDPESNENPIPIHPR